MILEFIKGARVKILDDFISNEFDCHCVYQDCNFTYIDMNHVSHLQDKRKVLKKPIIITSAFRCTKHNRDIGGKKGSYHLLGKATDIKIEGFSIEEMEESFKDFDGMGTYPSKNFIHVDSRGYKSRWIG